MTVDLDMWRHALGVDWVVIEFQPDRHAIQRGRLLFHDA